MMRIQLSPEDRERFGAPEWIHWDNTLTQVEAEVLEEDFDVDPDDFRDWAMKPVLKDGEPVLDSEGKPVTRLRVRAYRFFVWVALRRAGVNVNPSTLDFARKGFRLEPDEETNPGKDPSPETPSENAESATP